VSLAEAIETGDLARLPSRRDEDWRWTDLRALIRLAPPRSAPWDGPLPPGPFADVGAEEVLVVNGHGPARLVLASGERRTLALRLVAAPNAGAHIARIAIDVGAGAELCLLESHEGLCEDYLIHADLDLTMGERARVERVVVSRQTASGVSVVSASIHGGRGGDFAQTIGGSGARRERIETRILNPGAGMSVRLDGVYLISGRRHLDITTVVTHVGPGGSTDQLIKGVADDQARAVFQGRIVVAEGADQTDARMGHHALILSDRAEVDAKPELEIYADDVACGHGNTVGALDEDALFYARQRGIPEFQARALLTRAFIGAVVDRIAHDGAREAVGAWVADHLESPT
jgi:Fe-S cluster assembly protein SufD